MVGEPDRGEVHKPCTWEPTRWVARRMGNDGYAGMVGTACGTKLIDRISWLEKQPT